MRSVKEIKAFAEGKGMETEVRDRGTSYRAGGDIICFPKGFDWRNAEVAIKRERNFGFKETGRWYDLWIIVPAREGETAYRLAAYTAWKNAEADKRLCIGNEEEGRSGEAGLFFIEPGADKFGDLEELFAGWTE